MLLELSVNRLLFLGKPLSLLHLDLLLRLLDEFLVVTFLFVTEFVSAFGDGRRGFNYGLEYFDLVIRSWG